MPESADGASKPEKCRCIVPQNRGTVSGGNLWLIAHELADACLAQREGRVAADHDAARAHRLDQQTQRSGIKHRTVHAEPIQVVAGRVLRYAAHNVTPVPRILQSSKQIGEATAAMRKADAQIAR